MLPTGKAIFVKFVLFPSHTPVKLAMRVKFRVSGASVLVLNVNKTLLLLTFVPFCGEDNWTVHAEAENDRIAIIEIIDTRVLKTFCLISFPLTEEEGHNSYLNIPIVEYSKGVKISQISFTNLNPNSL